MSVSLNNGEVPTPEVFGKETTIPAFDSNNQPIRWVLLTDGRIAKIREGKGKDVERATLISNGDQSKYLSSVMSATIEIDEKPIIMEDLGELGMKDYMRLQLAFSDLNF